MYLYKWINVPIGPIKLVASDKGLVGLLWEDDKPKRTHFEPQQLDEKHPILLEAEQQLNEFFAGQRTVFKLPLDFKGTAFQKAVWSALLTVPFGETRTYGDIAKAINNSKAVRAVGAANGRNPIAIICPCHRIIGADGSLTGFAGGLKIKAALLELESQKR